MEENLRNFFLGVKEEFRDKPIVFLSNRFQNIYEVLVRKYPEIKLPITFSEEEYTSMHLSFDVVYLNDIFNEIPSRFNEDKDIICCYSNYDKFHFQEDIKNKKFISLDENTDFMKQKISDRELVKMEMKAKYFENLSGNQVVDLLDEEQNILMDGGINLLNDKLPLGFRPLFEQFMYYGEPFKYLYDSLNELMGVYKLSKSHNPLIRKIRQKKLYYKKIKIIKQTYLKYGNNCLPENVVDWILENEIIDVDILNHDKMGLYYRICEENFMYEDSLLKKIKF